MPTDSFSDNIHRVTLNHKVLGIILEIETIHFFYKDNFIQKLLEHNSLNIILAWLWVREEMVHINSLLGTSDAKYRGKLSSCLFYIQVDLLRYSFSYLPPDLPQSTTEFYITLFFTFHFYKNYFTTYIY